MANLIRDRKGNLWTVSQYEGRFIAACDYGLGIKATFSGSREYVETMARTAN